MKNGFLRALAALLLLAVCMPFAFADSALDSVQLPDFSGIVENAQEGEEFSDFSGTLTVPGNPMWELAQEPMDEQKEEDAIRAYYDEMMERDRLYTPEAGVVVGDALRAKGQPTLDDVEIEVMIALEEAGSGDGFAGDDELVNILLLGVDARPGQGNGRSDAMILCSVNPKTGKIKLISFMRDLYVKIPDHNPHKLNAAYYWGGPELLFATLSKNFGVTADHYVAVDYSMLASIIDQVGGLEIEITDNYFVDRINAVIQNDNKDKGLKENDGLLPKKTGVQLLTGKQAQAYARFRYGAKSGGDYARTGRQREVLMKLFKKMTSEMSIAELLKLAMANLDQVRTDLTIADIAKLAPLALSLKDAEFAELRIPTDGTFKAQTVKKMSVLMPDYDKVRRQIRDFLAE